ncbi:MAG: hypothetical protein QW756_06790, partial [Nitrososphaerota archaeon]
KVAEKQAGRRLRPGEISTFLILGYILLGILFPDHPTIFNLIVMYTPIPYALAYALFTVMALLVYVGSDPALWVSTVSGVGAAVWGALAPASLFTSASIALAVAWAASSMLAALRMRRRRTGKSADLREFSGWAGD